MANELVLNKILIIKGILAEKCVLHPDLYEELSDLLDDIRILNDAKDSALAELSHESSGLNKPVVTVSLRLSNEQILKGIQTSPRYQLPIEWLKNEHINSNYMGGFLNAVRWMEGNAR